MATKTASPEIGKPLGSRGHVLLKIKRDKKIEGWSTILRVSDTGEFIVHSYSDEGDIMAGDYYQDLASALAGFESRAARS